MSRTPHPTAPPRPTRPGRRRRRLLIVGGIVLALVAGLLSWTAWSQRPLGTPQAVELTEARISDRLASATILGVGEATHGTSEFRRVWQWATEQLADRGFTTLAFEEDAGSVSQVNEWVQGGPGTAEQAADRFGFGLNVTREMADLLTWVRAYNAARPESQRIQLHGVDFQRPEADKAVALAWLATVDAEAAARHETALADMVDDSHYDQAASARWRPPADALRASVEAAADGRTDDAAVRAVLSARALSRGAERGEAGVNSDARDRLMADQLADIVAFRADQGGHHTLLFAHNGHVDRSPTPHPLLGTMLGNHAAQRWGEAYRVIGTDANRVRLTDQGEEFSFTVNSSMRGMFAGTRVGYLEFADANPENRAVLETTQIMASAGSPFQAVTAWVPFLHEVQVTPVASYDALVYVTDSTGTTRLPRR